RPAQPRRTSHAPREWPTVSYCVVDHRRGPLRGAPSLRVRAEMGEGLTSPCTCTGTGPRPSSGQVETLDSGIVTVISLPTNGRTRPRTMTMARRHGLHWRPSKRRCRTAAEATSETFRCEISGPRLVSALERLTGDGMNRDGLVVSLGLAAGLAAVLSAQVPSSNGNVDQKPIQSIKVKVIGCVAGGKEVGHSRVTNASLSGD